MQYLQHYPLQIQKQVEGLIKSNNLSSYLINKYPEPHALRSEKLLYQYCLQIKNEYIKKSAPLSKVIYDPKLHVIKHALGLHTFISRVQGNKTKAKNEIRISTLFRTAPQAFLDMILVHELAHLKEKEHNKAFYQLCLRMLPEYHQLELDTRIYLTHLSLFGELYN